MGWVDQALATLSPADVAGRVSSYVHQVPVEESYSALRRALPSMPPADLAQLAMAFDVPLSLEAPDRPEMLFDDDARQTAVLAHFLTVPEEFRARLERFLQAHPRALGYFDDADAERMLQLQPKRKPPYVAIGLTAAAALVSILLGFGATWWWFSHPRAQPRDPVVLATAAPTSPAASSGPRSSSRPQAGGKRPPAGRPQPASAQVPAAVPPATGNGEQYAPAPYGNPQQPYVASQAPPASRAPRATPRPSPSARWDGTWKFDPAANRYVHESPLPPDTTPPSTPGPSASANPTPAAAPSPT